MTKNIFLLSFIFLTTWLTGQQIPNVSHIPAEVDFSVHLRTWDGFGFNYVETAQTMDYSKDPQDYGGFSLLNQQQKNEIVNLVFGEDGLKVNLVKMFLDPWHQSAPGAPFDHTTTTANMREFVKAGYAVTKKRGADLQIITTLYGPPAWATLQKSLRGRDLDTAMKKPLAEYMIHWTKFLKEKEGLPVKYISLHNEGDDWMRWPRDGKATYIGNGHDYNMWWPPHQVVDFIKFMPEIIKKAGLTDVQLTNGECTNWHRFSHWGEAWAIAENDTALNNLGLITSHGFFEPKFFYWYGDHTSFGLDLIRAKKTNMHAWVTSCSWAKMDVHFIRQIYGHIYSVGVNGFIPWAGIQRPTVWVSGDPNPGNAIQVHEDGTYTVRSGYYLYKQVSRAGQAGMAVAKTYAMDTEVAIIAFAKNGTKNPDAFIVANIKLDDWQSPEVSLEMDKKIAISVKGSQATKFKAYRTNGSSELFAYKGEYLIVNGAIEYTAPKGSVTTFFAVE